MTDSSAGLSRRRFLTNTCILTGSVASLPQRLIADVVAPISTSPSTPGAANDVLGNRPLQLQPGVPQYFFDDSLISHQRRLIRRWLPAVINPQPVLLPDKPWEQRQIQLHGSILPAPDGGYRIYYAGGGNVLVAFSPDGLTWHKPELDIVPWEGRPSNILIQGLTKTKYWSVASINVIHDDQDKQYPYKLTSFQKPVDGKEGGLFVYQSKDGLRFEEIPGMRFEMGDRNTMMGSRVNGKFVGYVRKVRMFKNVGVRSVHYTESENFLDWTEPQLVLAPDLQDDPDVEFYGMAVFKRHDWFIGLLENWRADTDVMEVQLAFSRDGKHWQRPQPRVTFIGPTYDWNQSWNNCASNGPIFLKEQMAFYFGGNSVGHHFSTTRRSGAIGLASLELDRFCALEGTTEQGWVDTIPLIWPGGELVVNADTRESFVSHPTKANGTLYVEVLDASGAQLPEWSGQKKRATFQGNTHCRENIADGTVRWPGGRNLDPFIGRPIRLRFVMKHARLFTFEAKHAF